MAGSNKNMLSSVPGIVGAGFSAFQNRPRRSQVDYSPLAGMAVGFRPSDMDGLMAQYGNVNWAPALTSKDLYNPSVGDQFKSYLGAGLTMYGATKGLTDNLKGTMGTTQIGGKQSAPGTTPSHVDTELMQNAKTREEQMDIAGGAFQDMGLGATGTELSVRAANMPTQNVQQDNGWITGNNYPYTFGLACGGHKHATGGMFDNGAMVGEAINLLGAGLGIGLNAIGQAEEKKKALADAAAYNFDRQYVLDKMSHDYELAVHDTKNNMFNMQATQLKAHGGDLHTQGADFPMSGEYNFIGSGGTHEQNPYEGVPQGVAADGQTNLVEQNEVVWNDYVFSNRLYVPGTIRSKYKLKDKLTFSEAAEKLVAEAKERPNDPISQNGIEAKLGELQASQEEVRMKKAAAQVKKELAGMSPEELLYIQQLMQQGQPMDIQAAYAACGGHKHAEGGHKFDGEDGSQMTRYSGPRNRVYTAPDGKQYLVTQDWLDDLHRGLIHITNTDGKLGFKTIEDEDKRRSHRFNSKGEAIARRYNRRADGTVEELLGDFENDANFLDASGNLNPPRYDESKTEEEVRALEQSQAYKDTDALIKEVIRKHNNKEALSPKEQAVYDYLYKVDKQFTLDHKKGPMVFNSDGTFKKDAEDTLLKDKGLRYDQKWGPNHWTVDQIYREPEAIKTADNEWTFGEYVPEERTPATEVVNQRTPQPALFTGMRYAPLLSPLLSEYTPRDYSTLIPPREATYRGIGDYLPYNPVDSQRYLTAIEQQNAARRGAIQNMSGANRNMAMAQDALAEYQRQQDIANVLQNAEQINFDRRAKVGEFNRGTNMFNAGAYNQAQMASMRIPEFQFHQAANNARMRKAVDDAIDEAKGVNRSGFLDTLHNIGRENTYLNMANSNPAFYYGLGLNGILDYKQPIGACGGMLTKKQRKGRG